MTNQDDNEVIYITEKYFKNNQNNQNNIDKNILDNTSKYIYVVAYIIDKNIKQQIELGYYDTLHYAYNHLYSLYKILPEFFYMDYHIKTYIVKNNKYENTNKIYRIKRNYKKFV